MRRLLGLFLVSLVLLPTSVAAHTNTVEVDPADGAIVEKLPPEATMTFGETPTQVNVVLADPEGTVRKLTPEVDGSTVAVRLPAAGPRGDYTLSYRVVSADGHPVSGSSTFTVTTGPAPTTTPTATVDPAAAQATTPWATLAIAGGAALVALAAGLLFWLMRR